MNKRGTEIINVLLKSDTTVTSVELSKILNISARTVKRVIKDVDFSLRENGAKIISDKNGYKIAIDDDSKFTHFWDEQQRLLKELLIDNTVTYQILEQLFLREYVTQDDLSDYIFVSRSTINKYIKHVKKLLQKEQIILSNRPHYGYYLIGQETNIRNYMVKLFFPDEEVSTLEESKLISKCRDYPGFYKSVIKLLYEYDYDEHDAKTQSLIKYFIVLANRFYQNRHIEQYNEGIQLFDTSKELAIKLKTIIENYYGITIDENEVIYLSYLIGNPTKQLKEKDYYDVSFFEVVVDKFFQEIKDVYQQDFTYDEILRKGLIQHLYASYSRIYINALLDNPMISMIKTQYIEAYNYAIVCGRVLYKEYKLDMNEDSLGYIAMHFAASMERINALYKYKAVVVCESGYGMAQLLSTRIKNKINSIEITDVVSAKQLTEMNLDEIVLIISSVPISKDIKTPVIIVNPVLMEQDIEKIKEYLSDYRNINEYKKLFDIDRFFPKLKVNNKEELLDYVCVKLIEKGFLNEDNKADILRREEISSTEINDLVAVPHCILDSENKTHFTIITCENEIYWGKGEAKIIFLGAIAKSSTTNKKIFPILYKLTMDRNKVEELSQIDDFETFIEELFANLPVSYD